MKNAMLQGEKRRLEGFRLAGRDGRRRVSEGISRGRAKVARPISAKSGTYVSEEGHKRK